MRKFDDVKSYRLALCMSQQQLAQRLNVSCSAVSKWEADKNMPPNFLLDYLDIILLKNA